jgi:hypothetical protein
MALAAGSELGPYEIHSSLGVSGGYRVLARNKGDPFLVAHYPNLSSSLTLVANWDLEVRK